MVTERLILPDNNKAGFAAGTLVHTSGGLCPIESVQKGDWVLSFPRNQAPPPRLRERNEYVYRQVTGTFEHIDEVVCDVTVWDLGNDLKEVLKVTPNHGLYVKGGGWTEVAGLKFGNALLTYEFANLLVKAMADTQERCPVYDIQVQDFQTYYVGDLGAWVHQNRDPAGHV